jgi:hypothetical protein
LSDLQGSRAFERQEFEKDASHKLREKEEFVFGELTGFQDGAFSDRTSAPIPTTTNPEKASLTAGILTKSGL